MTSAGVILGRLSLGTKLLLAPAVATLALVFVAVAAYYGLEQQRSTIGRINDVRFARLQLVMEVNAFTEEAKHDLERLLSAPQGGVETALVEVVNDELLGKVRSVIQTLDFLTRQPPLDPKERSAIEEAMGSLRLYTEAVQQTIAAGRSDPVGLKRLDSASEVLTWNLAKLVGVERELTSLAFTQSERDSRRLLWAFSALLLLSLVAALAATWIVTRYIRSTVAAIHTAASAMSGGDLTRRAEVLSDDEIGQTARAFNVLVDALARRAQERFRLAMDQSPDALILVDRAEMKVLDANVTAAQRAGISRDEFLLSAIWERRSGASREELERVYDAVIAMAPQTQVEELALQGPHGVEYPAEVSRRAMRIEGRWVIVISARDITEQKNADAELQRRLDDLARSNQELERFAYVASHDLAEPLRMIASYAQLLERRYRGRLDADAGEFIGFITGGARRMKQLLDDLLAYSRVGRAERKPDEVAMDDVLHDVLDNLMVLVEERGAVVESPALPVVLGDRTEMTQLVQNLVGNALKFQAPGRPVRVRIHASEYEGGWLFSVADNGIGIAPEYFERIFVIFQRLHTRESYSGTGIGLAICKKIVEAVGGRIWVESRPGEGTTFFFTLPRAQPAKEADPASEALLREER
ncbi:MAG: ATP-binding protein [Pseudomonadota bacterium]